MAQANDSLAAYDEDVETGRLGGGIDDLLTDDEQLGDGLIGGDMDGVLDLLEEDIGDKHKAIIETEVKDLQGCKNTKITWMDESYTNKTDETKDDSKQNENIPKNKYEKRISKSKHFNYDNSDALIEIELENADFSVYVGTDVMSTNQSGYYRLQQSEDKKTYLVMENEEGTKKFESIGQLLMGYEDTKPFRKNATANAIQQGLESAK